MFEKEEVLDTLPGYDDRDTSDGDVPGTPEPTDGTTGPSAGFTNAMVVPMDNDYYALSVPLRCTECGASHMHNTRRLHMHSRHTRTPSRTHTQV